MSSIEKRNRNGKVTWHADYRDPAGRQHSRTFPRKGDAEKYLTTIETAKLTEVTSSPRTQR